MLIGQPFLEVMFALMTVTRCVTLVYVISMPKSTLMVDSARTTSAIVLTMELQEEQLLEPSTNMEQHLALHTVNIFASHVMPDITSVRTLMLHFKTFAIPTNVHARPTVRLQQLHGTQMLLSHAYQTLQISVILALIVKPVLVQTDQLDLPALQTKQTKNKPNHS